MKKGTKILSGAALMMALSAGQAGAATPVVNLTTTSTIVADNTKYVTKRPAEADRLFVSDAVEKKIKEVKKLLKDNPYLAWMFENCYPNTLTPLLTSTARTTLSSIRATYTPCGCVTAAPRCGLMCSSATRTRS